MEKNLEREQLEQSTKQFYAVSRFATEHTQLISEQSTQTGMLPYLYNLPPKNNYFNGRTQLLEEIAYCLKTSSQAPHSFLKSTSLAGCHGLGGIGKTQLATEYVYTHLEDYIAIIWIDAETPAQIEEAFYKMAAEWQLFFETSQMAIDGVKRWLENHPGYLLVFDNVEHYEVVEPYLPRFNGQVLITSRHIQWPGKSIAVNVFSSEEAKAYIRNILGKEIAKKEHDCEQLAKVMGYLPLALAQACAYVKENPITLKKYLKLYERKREVLLSSPLMPKVDKHLPMYVSWDITIDKFKTKLRSNIAEQLLMICACLNHNGIPKKLLTTYLSQNKIEDEIEQIEILRLLTNYSLLTFDTNIKSYSIHPVMQEVLIIKQTSELQVKYLKQVINLLLVCYPYTGSQLKHITLKRKLITHLEIIINKIEKGTLNLFSDKCEKEEAIINLSTFLADAYFTIRNSSKQKEWLEKVLPLQASIYGKDSYHLEVTLTNLANAYGGLGDLKKQEELLRQALDIHHKNLDTDPNEKVLGLVTILLNMSNSYDKFNNRTKKIELLQQALSIQLEQNMRHKPTWAMSLMNLGSAYASSGLIKEGLELLEEALELHKGLYGNEHPTFALNARELGSAYGLLKSWPHN